MDMLSNSNGYEREVRLMEADDRGVFGPEGLTLSAGLRRKFKTALLPVRARAWQFIREKKFGEAEELLLQSLPRNAADLDDERYFGIYCGLADVALAKDDGLAALDWFRQAIEKFPSAIRQNHIVQLARLGVDVSRWIRSEREDGMNESDAAAVLSKVIDAMNGLATTKKAIHAHGKALQEFSRLERGAGNEVRSGIRGYLG